jgi:hypothetical protein
MKTRTVRSIFLILILISSFTNFSSAEIIHTNVNHTLSKNTLYLLDLNNDGINDFKFSYNYLTVQICDPEFPVPKYVHSTASVTALNSNFEVANYIGKPAALNLNDTIWGNWVTPTAAILLHVDCTCASGNYGYNGNWNSSADHYLPVRFSSEGDWYYGWIGMHISDSPHANINFTIFDYAYESTPNQPLFLEAMLIVSPPIEYVTDSAGTTYFNVASNLNWNVVSSAAWCTVNPSGSGNDTIIATYSQNTNAWGRTAYIHITTEGLNPVSVTVSQDGAGSVGIGENSTADFLVYPNSASESITIQLSESVSSINGTVSIYGITGQELIKQNAEGSKMQINISSMPAGIYFVRLINQETNVPVTIGIVKFIKN